ncbi:hypothetical protein J6590_008303 [Homalodisca vitripennis]|nr:hypothetical protein J6590_008303 [Homalodisca vitripennis]
MTHLSLNLSSTQTRCSKNYNLESGFESVPHWMKKVHRSAYIVAKSQNARTLLVHGRVIEPHKHVSGSGAAWTAHNTVHQLHEEDRVLNSSASIYVMKTEVNLKQWNRNI